jgi:hypothetical protein
MKSTTLDVFNALQNLFRLIEGGSSFRDYARPEGQLFTMAAVESVWYRE